MIDDWYISFEIALNLKSLDITGDKSTLVPVIAFCHNAAKVTWTNVCPDLRRQTTLDLNNSSISPWQWRYNEPDNITNHQCLDCLFNRLFRRRSKKTSKLRVTDLYEFTGDRWIPRTKGQ